MKFVHVSDLHMVPGNALLYGLNPQERLRACVAHINLHHADAELAVEQCIAWHHMQIGYV